MRALNRSCRFKRPFSYTKSLMAGASAKKAHPDSRICESRLRACHAPVLGFRPEGWASRTDRSILSSLDTVPYEFRPILSNSTRSLAPRRAAMQCIPALMPLHPCVVLPGMTGLKPESDVGLRPERFILPRSCSRPSSEATRPLHSRSNFPGLTHPGFLFRLEESSPVEARNWSFADPQR